MGVVLAWVILLGPSNVVAVYNQAMLHRAATAVGAAGLKSLSSDLRT